jgi:hypothetical protein
MSNTLSYNVSKLKSNHPVAAKKPKKPETNETGDIVKQNNNSDASIPSERHKCVSIFRVAEGLHYTKIQTGTRERETLPHTQPTSLRSPLIPTPPYQPPKPHAAPNHPIQTAHSDRSFQTAHSFRLTTSSTDLRNDTKKHLITIPGVIN